MMGKKYMYISTLKDPRFPWKARAVVRGYHGNLDSHLCSPDPGWSPCRPDENISLEDMLKVTGLDAKRDAFCCDGMTKDDKTCCFYVVSFMMFQDYVYLIFWLKMPTYHHELRGLFSIWSDTGG